MRPSDLSLVGEKGSVGMSERERDCGGEYLIGIRSHECVRWGGVVHVEVDGDAR